MKTKLTLNIDDGIIEEIKILSKKRKQSISAIVEEYFKNLTSGSSVKKQGKETFTQRFRRLYPVKKILNFDYKEERHNYLDKKYGRK